MEKYKIKVLFIHRKEGYPGQNAPEAVEVIDEYSSQENPCWLEEKECEARKQEDISSVAIIEIELDRSQIEKILYPEGTPIEGVIKEA